ncbi:MULTISPECIES: DUF6572 domain-containing protein [Enterobacter]|uniref:DUF6572 domain-containing protein n=1 Tax=Enterobacter TaxID=547 RepID=UPI000651E4C4|nr:MULTISPECIES: DUF6572 domain-containing protein [Enterobacter]MBG0621530.1 hypothetical protein [Enterobacter roggenkampii]MBG0670586.1 hypothetical protein [Enterobacter roggenkampii]OEI72295.1 hypothetical protein BFG58_22720 [Enterobacter sp. ku-bf2]RAY95881.1 hypothetical protein DP187_24210 [Enterobacter cloacae]
MSVEDLNKIDFMGIPENEPDAISLAISDHLAWGENTNDHLYKLQEKINSYIEFIDSGHMEESFPKSKGKTKKIIEIYFKNSPPKDVLFFFDKVESVLAGINVKLQLK